jgi:hypothetical protein
MNIFSQLLASVFAFSLLASPASALVQPAATPAALAAPSAALQLLSPLKSFGGRVTWVEFCLDGSIFIIIEPSGLFPVNYIWTPYTITQKFGPPTTKGQQVLGLFDLPWVCVIDEGGLFSGPELRFGFRMFLVGTSLPGTVPAAATPVTGV